jgi:hypothetical protein
MSSCVHLPSLHQSSSFESERVEFDRALLHAMSINAMAAIARDVNP